MMLYPCAGINYVAQDPQPTDLLKLKGRVRRISDWRQGFDELQSIPHSFAIEFKDDETPWFLYCDSEEAKASRPIPHRALFQSFDPP
jgi:hypothetical protein